MRPNETGPEQRSSALEFQTEALPSVWVLDCASWERYSTPAGWASVVKSHRERRLQNLCRRRTARDVEQRNRHFD